MFIAATELQTCSLQWQVCKSVHCSNRAASVLIATTGLQECSLQLQSCKRAHCNDRIEAAILELWRSTPALQLTVLWAAVKKKTRSSPESVPTVSNERIQPDLVQSADVGDLLLGGVYFTLTHNYAVPALSGSGGRAHDIGWYYSYGWARGCGGSRWVWGWEMRGGGGVRGGGGGGGVISKETVGNSLDTNAIWGHEYNQNHSDRVISSQWNQHLQQKSVWLQYVHDWVLSTRSIVLPTSAFRKRARLLRTLGLDQMSESSIRTTERQNTIKPTFYCRFWVYSLGWFWYI